MIGVREQYLESLLELQCETFLSVHVYIFPAKEFGFKLFCDALKRNIYRYLPYFLPVLTNATIFSDGVLGVG